MSTFRKSDQTLEQDIRLAFEKQAVPRTIENHEIEIAVENGRVTLSGHMADAGSNELIKMALQGVQGIIALKNELVFEDRPAGRETILPGKLNDPSMSEELATNDSLGG